MANPWWTGNVSVSSPMRSSLAAPPGEEGESSALMSASELGFIGRKRSFVDEGDEQGNSQETENEIENVRTGLEIVPGTELGTGLRRSRGRPRGSKNKPKPLAVAANKGTQDSLHSHVLEIASGSDLTNCISEFARRRHVGVSVLSGRGSVTNVTLRQPLAPGGVMTLQGRFDIVNLCGAFMPPPSPPGVNGLTVYLAGPQGQLVGGMVVGGGLVAAGPVTVVAATYGNVTY